jgi:hypothetical protein
MTLAAFEAFRGRQPVCHRKGWLPPRKLHRRCPRGLETREGAAVNLIAKTTASLRREGYHVEVFTVLSMRGRMRPEHAQHFEYAPILAQLGP